MKSLSILLVALTVTVAAHGDDAPKDPKAILTRAQAALASVKTLSYTAELRRDEQPTLTAQVVCRLDVEDELPRFRLDSKGLRMRGDGRRIAVIDPAKKSVTWTTDVDALLEDEATAPLLDLVNPGFFDGGEGSLLREAAASKRLTLVGTADIGKEPCYALTFAFHDPDEKEPLTIALWISRRDFVMRQLKDPEGTTTLTGLKVNPTVAADAFSTKAPEGYTTRTIKVIQAPAVGAVAPDWTLKRTDGTPVTLGTLAGKVVLFTFWASW